MPSSPEGHSAREADGYGPGVRWPGILALVLLVALLAGWWLGREAEAPDYDRIRSEAAE